MNYKLTTKSQNSKKCKDGKSRNFLIFFLNGTQILKQKRSFDENKEHGFDGRWHYKDIFLLNNNLHQTRYDENGRRCVKFPVSKKVLKQFEIPKDHKIELSEDKIIIN